MKPEEIVEQQYRRRFATAASYRDRLWQVLCKNFFQQYIAPGDTVLDLGCGWGEFINNIHAASKLAMDMNPDAKNHVDRDVQLIQQDCSERWPFDSGSLDVVFTSNFLEHLPGKSSVEATLREIGRCLKPSGTLIALGPNINLVPGLYWDYWDHHTPISDNSLSEVLELSGFTVEKRIPAFLPYTMSGGRNPPIFVVRLYLLLPWAWRFFGKQFLIIART